MADNRRIEDLRRRVQLDPASIAFAALAEEYRRSGQFENAIATCQAGLQRHPAYISARVTLGRSLLELQRFDEARQELENVLRVAPENLAAIRGLAEIHERTGETSVPDSLTAAEGHEQTPDASEPPPAPIEAPEPAPIRPVKLSIVPDPPAPAEPQAPQPAPSAYPVPTPSLSLAPARVPHPDESALPALEAFLAAIVRARQSMGRDNQSTR